MFDQLLLTINSWMTGSFAFAALGCLLWGMISVLFSPCHMASIPLIVAYVGGQQKILLGRQAVFYAVLFTTGLFITILVVGIICAILGRMLGDVGPYWGIAIGLLLIWVGLNMLGVKKCALPGKTLGKIQLTGAVGAFVLGLAYGVLSGSCTFGFIAPILAVITIQQEIASGIFLLLLFALGHCIPIAVAGSSSALVKQVLYNKAMLRSGHWVRRGAGMLIVGLGIYFIVQPLMAL